MLTQLIGHAEHGLVRLRDDYFARRRAVVGGILLASCLLIGEILALQIGHAIVGSLIQLVLSAFGFALGLIYAAWPNNPRQTVLGVLGGTATFCLLALGGGLLLAMLIFLIAFIPAAVGGIPTIGGALLGLFAVLLGGLAGSLMVVGSAAIIALAGFVTLRVAAGSDLDDDLVNETVRMASDKKRFVPVLSCLIGAALLAISALAVLNVGTRRLLKLNVGSEGMGDLAGGLHYLMGIENIGVTFVSTGNVALSGLLAGVFTVLAIAIVLGFLLALPLAIAARSTLIFMGVNNADFTVAHASSLRYTEEEEPPVVDEDDLANLDLREAVVRPENWHPEAGRARESELLQVKQRDTSNYELEGRGSIPGLDE